MGKSNAAKYLKDYPKGSAIEGFFRNISIRKRGFFFECILYCSEFEEEYAEKSEIFTAITSSDDRWELARCLQQLAFESDKIPYIGPRYVAHSFYGQGYIWDREKEQNGDSVDMEFASYDWEIAKRMANTLNKGFEYEHPEIKNCIEISDNSFAKIFLIGEKDVSSLTYEEKLNTLSSYFGKKVSTWVALQNSHLITFEEHVNFELIVPR